MSPHRATTALDRARVVDKWAVMAYLSTTMFIRFRRRGSRLHVVLLVNSREDGRVRQRHVASLGRLRDTRWRAMAAWVEPYERGSIWQHLFEAADEHRIEREVLVQLTQALEARVSFPSPSEIAELLRSLGPTNILGKQWPEICARRSSLMQQ